MADHFNFIKVENTFSSTEHSSSVNLTESEAANVEVINVSPLKDFHKITPVFITAKDQTTDINTESTDVLSGDVAFPANMMSLCSSSGDLAASLPKEGEIHIELKEAGSTQVDFDSCVSVENNKRFVRADKGVQPGGGDFGDKTHSADSEPFVSKQNKKGSPRDHLLVPTSKTYSCEYCQQKFQTAQLLEQHETVHSSEKPFLCPAMGCSVRFAQRSHLEAHLPIHANKIRSSAAHANKIRSSAAQMSVKKVPCPLCSSKFKNKYDANRHLLTHFNSKRRFSCLYCNAKFYMKELFKAHVMAHSTIKPFSCSVCSSTFPECNKEGGLEGPPSASTSETFSCVYCPLKFRSAQLLGQHEVIHSSDHSTKSHRETRPANHPVGKPFLCPSMGCPGKFARKCCLTEHIATHSTESQSCKEQISCPCCSAKFKTEEQLKTHFLVHLRDAHLNHRSAITHLGTGLNPQSAQSNAEPLESDRHSAMTEHSISIKVEDVFSATEHSNLLESQPTETKASNVPASREEEETKEFCKITPSFVTAKDQIKEIKVENIDALLGDAVFSANIMSFPTTSCHSVDISLIKKEEDLGAYEEKEEVGFDSSVSFENDRRLVDAGEDSHQEVGDCNENAGSFQVSAVSFAVDLKPTVAECDKKGSLQDHSLASTSEPLFSCTYCPLRFQTTQHLSQYEVIHCKEKRFLCPAMNCSARFAEKDQLEVHLVFHSKSKQFFCRLCSSEFEDKFKLAKHLLTHIDEKKFSCAHCPAKFKTKRLLQSHSLVHSSVKPFSCPHCTSAFRFKSPLGTHLLAHSTVRQFSCLHCPSAFETQSQLGEHLLVHSSVRPFSCSHCPAAFQTKWRLTRHLLVHSNKRLFSCSYCTAAFKLKSHLSAHLVVHSHLRPFSCTKCTSTFPTKSELGTHILAHSSVRLISCSHCPAAFKTQSKLKEHSLVHSNVRPFSCSHCTSAFKTKSKLTRHLLIHSDERPFSCSYCTSTFRLKSHLRSHLLVHSNVKPFTCSYCTSNFKTRYNLTSHLQTHSKSKRYSCASCTSTFRTKSHIKKHLRRVHMNKKPHS